MRNLALLAALTAAPVASAMELDPAVEVGAHAGVFAFDGLDVPNTSYLVSPRVGFWFHPSIGLELDVGISTGTTDVTGHDFLMVAPVLSMIGNPVPADLEAPIQPIFTLGLGMAYKAIDGDGVRGSDYAHTRLEALAKVGTGFIIPITGPLSARVDVKIAAMAARESELYVSPFIQFESTAGLAAKFGVAKDADKDSIPDKRDYCPTEPEDYDGFEDEDGCPEADNDLDGLEDGLDACPDEREDEDGWEDDDGCPDPDNDGDEVLDADDVCPDEAGPRETSGCPDADGDGFADKDDRCPEQKGSFEFQGCADTDLDGLPDPDDECPEVPGSLDAFGCEDDDSDRVPNYRDECPDRAAQEGIDATRSDGCPSRVYVTLDAIVIEDKVYFSSGSATIRSRSYGLLDDVAEVLNTYPSIKKVRIEGHTDDRGDDEMNLKLSQDRAQAVVDYLGTHGVDPERLVAKGFGETRPKADNGTSSGRSLNRRVAFTILEQETRTEEKDITEVEEGDDFEVIEEGADDAPAEDAPAEESTEDAPAEEPAEDAPAEEPAEDAPAEDAPAEE